MLITFSYGQNVIEGYTYEQGNRGYLSQVEIVVMDPSNETILVETKSDNDGKFVFDLPPISNISISFTKEMFHVKTIDVSLNGQKQFLKVEMERAPGYIFEVTLADKKDSANHAVDAIIGAHIEVYNNTTEKLVLRLENHPEKEFKLNMQKGNHYTILVRKKGYLAKQMEAFVNVKGCILCFEGVSNVKPGVTDNLTSGNEYGVLLANVEMDRIFSGKSFEVKNLYYDLNSAALKKESKVELDKVINVLRYNPNLTLELGSHTDSRGQDDFNMNLSERRAQSAVKYITDEGGIPKFRIFAKGYGETLLRNECGDNVKCSEAKHQENRRTEIKIIGINEDWVFKPLENIKNEIKMEAEIQRMIRGESNQVSEEEYKALNKEINEKEQGEVSINLESNNPAPKVSEEIIEEIPAFNDQEVYSREPTGEIEKVITPNKDEEILKEEVEIHTNSQEKNTQISNGYKVIIHYSGVPLAEDHPLFEKNPNLEVYVSTEKFYYYMIPGFKSTSDAESAIDDGLKSIYPSAYVAGFKDGKRIL